jgi:predicted transcriptional regulator
MRANSVINSEVKLVDLTSEITAAYVAHNSVSAAALPNLIAATYAALRQLAASPDEVLVEVAPVPKVPIRRSVTRDYIICLEDGLKFRSLRRHIKAQFGLSPDQYRKKWGLPADYPMVAPSYAAFRSALARHNGLGQRSKSKNPRASVG